MNLRILVADDHDIIRRGLKHLLTARPGWDVCAEAKTGREAVALCEQHKPDVVVMDVSMPDLNGLEAARRIRAQSWGHAVSIIALTGWGQDGDRALSKEAGCDGHLVKPVILSELESMLEHLRTKARSPALMEA